MIHSGHVDNITVGPGYQKTTYVPGVLKHWAHYISAEKPELEISLDHVASYFINYT